MKYSKEQFILKAREIHGWKYDYSKVEYINSRTKICIICPEHGEFWQTPHSHLQGRGCPKCKLQNATLTTEEFIRRAKEMHGDKYDYSKVVYKKNNEKVCIICPEHGEFFIYPKGHINKGKNGAGCPLCGEKNRRKNTTKTNEWFIKKAKEIHGDKYDYSKVEYKRTDKEVCIICPEHGEFWQTPNRHLANHGCPKCGGNEKLTSEEFIKKSKEIHGDKYDYSKVDYVNNQTKVCIICPKHGEFWQFPNGHMIGRGCPHCKSSLLENEVRNFLDKEGIKYIAQKRAKWLGKQSLDFYLPDFGTVIECQGKQHFVPSQYFGGEERFNKTVILDRTKRKLCEERNLKILYYTHCKYNYDYELITDLETLKNKIYEQVSGLHKN